MAVLSLKTELDVAELLLAEGWIPEEINSVLAFPLPRAAFHQLGNENAINHRSDVIKATPTTPATLYRARQRLLSAGWRDRELESLLKPYLYSQDPWSNQTIHQLQSDRWQQAADHPSWWQSPTPSLQQYRRAMARKRLVSLGCVIASVFITVAIFG